MGTLAFLILFSLAVVVLVGSPSEVDMEPERVVE